ncbi:EMG1 [Acanthosepion pharaonis]|uniref:EMG1 n=1 Tax=Acanthosepion pharaonis TaxID=158019 RepID=A0A812DF85_ACAPH|nr:EMG1 [Sepia pharaonis]
MFEYFYSFFSLSLSSSLFFVLFSICFVFLAVSLTLLRPLFFSLRERPRASLSLSLVSFPSVIFFQLLHRLSVHASDGPQKLLRVIKNPINNHLPVGCTKLTMSFNAPLCKDVKTLVPDDKPIVFVIGAMAHGSVDVDYTERSYSISSYPLSAALTCAKVCTAFEQGWGIE